jgi:SAM-dependent methyltransferase
MLSSSRADAKRRAQRHHYLVEVELADRLRAAPAATRGQVYGQVYDELFQRVPDHPQLSIGAGRRQRVVADRLKLVRRFCRPGGLLLEIGAGDCAFSIEASRHVDRVAAVDVSHEILDFGSARDNLDVYVTDGTSVPLADGSVDVAFSDQLIEHLHPEDVANQMREVHRVLAPGGVYVCITPNRANGPHDISGLFDEVARGFHLHEYTSGEMKDAFRAAGFDSFRFYVGGGGHYARVPGVVVSGSEWLYGRLPLSARRALRASTVVYAWLGLNVVARRSPSA